MRSARVDLVGSRLYFVDFSSGSAVPSEKYAKNHKIFKFLQSSTVYIDERTESLAPCDPRGSIGVSPTVKSSSFRVVWGFGRKYAFSAPGITQKSYFSIFFELFASWLLRLRHKSTKTTQNTHLTVVRSLHDTTTRSRGPYRFVFELLFSNKCAKLDVRSWSKTVRTTESIRKFNFSIKTYINEHYKVVLHERTTQVHYFKIFRFHMKFSSVHP